MPLTLTGWWGRWRPRTAASYMSLGASATASLWRPTGPPERLLVVSLLEHGHASVCSYSIAHHAVLPVLDRAAWPSQGCTVDRSGGTGWMGGAAPCTPTRPRWPPRAGRAWRTWQPRRGGTPVATPPGSWRRWSCWAGRARPCARRPRQREGLGRASSHPAKVQFVLVLRLPLQAVRLTLCWRCGSGATEYRALMACAVPMPRCANAHMRSWYRLCHILTRTRETKASSAILQDQKLVQCFLSSTHL